MFRPCLRFQFARNFFCSGGFWKGSRTVQLVLFTVVQIKPTGPDFGVSKCDHSSHPASLSLSLDESVNPISQFLRALPQTFCREIRIHKKLHVCVILWKLPSFSHWLYNEDRQTTTDCAVILYMQPNSAGLGQITADRPGLTAVAKGPKPWMSPQSQPAISVTSS